MLKRFGDGRDWFFQKRYGLFLHFGLYAIEGWHEQDQWRRFIPRKKYKKLQERFNPAEFDADRILDLAQSVGMEYVCLTTKHHDGFCLWDTAFTDFNVTNSPYGRDIVAQLADACHRREFPLGLYYSVVDWHHPNYPNQGRHHELPGPEPGDNPDWEKYLEFLRNQVCELCTNYGPLHHFFWDMNVPKHRDPAINAMLRGLQPNMVINDRGFDEGDFGTPERDHQATETERNLRFARPTEACNSVGAQSWGYRRNEDYYSTRHLIESIDGLLARGGNYLLNVGPDGAGRIPDQAEQLLRRIGAWLSGTRESHYGCTPASELTVNREVLLTRNGNTLYVHLTKSPKSEAAILKPIAQNPCRAVLLNTGASVETCVDVLPMFWESKRPFLILRNLPVDELANEVPVIRLDFSEPLAQTAEGDGEEVVG